MANNTSQQNRLLDSFNCGKGNYISANHSYTKGRYKAGVTPVNLLIVAIANQARGAEFSLQTDIGKMVIKLHAHQP